MELKVDSESAISGVPSESATSVGSSNGRAVRLSQSALRREFAVAQSSSPVLSLWKAVSDKLKDRGETKGFNHYLNQLGFSSNDMASVASFESDFVNWSKQRIRAMNAHAKAIVRGSHNIISLLYIITKNYY